MSNVFLWVLVNVCSKLIGLGSSQPGIPLMSGAVSWQDMIGKKCRAIRQKICDSTGTGTRPVNASEICEAQNLENTCRFLLISVDFG